MPATAPTSTAALTTGFGLASKTSSRSGADEAAGCCIAASVTDSLARGKACQSEQLETMLSPVERHLFAEHVLFGDGPSSWHVAPGLVTVRDEHIGAVRQLDRASALEAAPSCTDLGDRWLTPALVNGHTHLALCALRGTTSAAAVRGNVVEDLFFRVESALEPGDVRAFARMGAYESLRAGVACVWDHYYSGVEVAEALIDTGLGGVVAPTLQDLGGPGADDGDEALAATEQIASSARYASAGVFAAIGPHATDTVSDEAWGRATDLAARLDVPLHAHVAQSAAEIQRSEQRHGCSPVVRLERLGVLARARLLAVHVIFASAAELDALARHDTVLGFCPFSQAQFCFPARLADWQRAGVRWLVGTDCAASNDSMDVQRELRFVAAQPALATTFAERADAVPSSAAGAAALEAARVRQLETLSELTDPARLVSAVWSVPGELHRRARCGRIEVGALAHLACWDPQHPSLWPGTELLRAFAHADTAPALHGLMVAGRWRIPPGGELARDEQRDAAREANERLEHLLRRAGVSNS